MRFGITKTGRGVALAVLLAPAAWAGGMPPCTPDDRPCIENLAARLKASGWVGVVLLRDEASGSFTIDTVIPDSPAEKAGIRAGDILVAIDGVRVSGCTDESLAKARKDRRPGDAVVYTMRRDGADRELSVTLAPMPATVLARYLALYLAEAGAAPGHRQARAADTPKENDR